MPDGSLRYTVRFGLVTEGRAFELSDEILDLLIDERLRHRGPSKSPSWISPGVEMEIRRAVEEGLSAALGRLERVEERITKMSGPCCTPGCDWLTRAGNTFCDKCHAERCGGHEDRAPLQEVLDECDRILRVSRRTDTWGPILLDAATLRALRSHLADLLRGGKWGVNAQGHPGASRPQPVAETPTERPPDAPACT